MMLAHTFGSGGPDVEFLILAVSLVVLSIVLVVQKTAKPVVPVVLLVSGVGFGVGAFAVGGFAPPTASGDDITVVIEAPEEGAEVPADEPFQLRVQVTGGEIVTGSSRAPNAGHLHVSVDGELVSMPSTDTPEVTLGRGEHTVTVEFTDAAHAPFTPRITDEVRVVAR